MKSAVKSPLTLLDLYSGCGGLSLGFELTGQFRAVGGVDANEWAVKSYCANHPYASRAFEGPVEAEALTATDITRAIGYVPDVVIGGPPCQGFSRAGQRSGCDVRNKQVLTFLSLVCNLKPIAFVMENVDGLLTTGQRQRGELLERLRSDYEDAGYRTHCEVLNSADFRVPQRRRRLILVGIRDASARYKFPIPTAGETCGNLFPELTLPPYTTVSEALDDLPTPNGSEPQSYGRRKPKNWFQRYCRRGCDQLTCHTPSKHRPDMVVRLKQQRNGTRLYETWNHSWYRLKAESPSPAVKENHRAPFVHHVEPRVTTPRECARLQSFPDRFRLLGTKTAQLTQVGNAVPALLAAAIGASLAAALGKEVKRCAAFDDDLGFLAAS